MTLILQSRGDILHLQRGKTVPTQPPKGDLNLLNHSNAEAAILHKASQSPRNICLHYQKRVRKGLLWVCLSKKHYHYNHPNSTCPHHQVELLRSTITPPLSPLLPPLTPTLRIAAITSHKERVHISKSYLGQRHQNSKTWKNKTKLGSTEMPPV